MARTDPSQVPISEYLESHAKLNGGWRSFFHSNLFTALVIWMLSQAVLIGGIIVGLYFKISSLTEWKGNVDAKLQRMDDTGTIHDHYVDDEQGKQIKILEEKMSEVEKNSSHFDVIESEHRRLTKDVEDLKDAQRDRR